MTAEAAIYQRMGMDKLRDQAATEGDGQDEAAQHFVDRLADMELERRLVMRHNRPGWHPSSPGFGDGTGSSTVKREPLAEEYDRGNITNSPWHDRANRAFAALPERQAAALLLQTAKTDPQTSGPFGASYDQMAASIGHFLQPLGWAPVSPMSPILERDDKGRPVYVSRDPEKEGGAKIASWSNPAFKNGQAIKWAARQGRVSLLMQAKVGLL